ncbi:MAG: radical SAM family heme chaperone HemW [Parvibaculaceae bacterium]
MVLTLGRRDDQDWTDLEASRAAEEAFGVYVHWPFCLAKCPYCDFNSHVRAAGVDAMGFAEALKSELSWFAERTPSRRVTSVFFGGGTPSLMPPAAVEAVIEAIGRLWQVAPDCEVTLEANPTSVEAGNFAGYRAAGVNRVSVGVQALNDTDLKALGRLHTAEEAIAAYRLAARIFPRTSFDLIYARPGQTAERWKAELSRALSEQQGHMSLYQLTIEPGTPFEALHAKGRLLTPDEDMGAALYDLTQELTERAGLPAYEVSNHAAPGAECRHNLLYWRGGEYAGVGPGAHSRLVGACGTRKGLSTERHPETWRALVGAQGSGVREETALSGAESAEEYLLMGLRLSEGIDLARHERLGGAALSAEKLSFLASEGLIEVAGRRLKATPAGRHVLNALIAELC